MGIAFRCTFLESRRSFHCADQEIVVLYPPRLPDGYAPMSRTASDDLVLPSISALTLVGEYTSSTWLDDSTVLAVPRQTPLA